jgi:hypothetical protein
MNLRRLRSGKSRALTAMISAMCRWPARHRCRRARARAGMTMAQPLLVAQVAVDAAGGNAACGGDGEQDDPDRNRGGCGLWAHQARQDPGVGPACQAHWQSARNTRIYAPAAARIPRPWAVQIGGSCAVGHQATLLTWPGHGRRAVARRGGQDGPRGA